MEEVFPTAKREMCPSEEMSGLMIQIWKSWTYLWNLTTKLNMNTKKKRVIFFFFKRGSKFEFRYLKGGVSKGQRERKIR